MLIPACNGTETPFLVNGRRWLYCYDTQLKKHGYLDMDNDMVVWNRNFHPAFAPEFEHTLEELILAPAGKKARTKQFHPYPNFYF